MHSAEESLHQIAATSGFISHFLLWFTIMWGIFLRNGWAMTQVRHSTLYAVHMVFALLGLTLGTIHAFAQLFVPGTKVHVIDEFIPFLNIDDPIGVGTGTLGLEIMIAAALSITIQRMLGFSRWRALHTLTYVAFTMVVVHILVSGTDVEPPLTWGSVLVSWVVVALTWLATTPWMRGVQKMGAGRSAARQHGQEITINVDAQRCVQFGFCEHEAPEIFTLRSDGRLAYRATVPVDDTTAVVRAAEVCPARAILLNRMPTMVVTPQPPAQSDPPTPAGPPGSPVGVSRGVRGGGSVTGLRRRPQGRTQARGGWR